MSYSLYIHTNKVNGKKYVGTTTGKPENRWGKNGIGYKNQFFYKAIQKYGWDNFDHFILEVDSPELMYQLEQQYISYYKTTDRRYGYNMSIGGEGGGNKGKNSLSDEYIKKYCKSHKDEKREYDRIYRIENIWKRKEKDKKWYQLHRKKVKEIEPISSLW